MKTWLKWTATAAVGLAAAAAAAAWTGVELGERKLQRDVPVPVMPVALLDDAVHVARGGYLFRSRGCGECHGADGAGREFINDGKGMRVAAPNITPGAGSAVAGYRPEDWDRVIRHGVKPSGKPLLVMPSEDFNRLTDDDLASIVAYVRTLPARAGGATRFDLPLPVRVLYGFGAIKDAAAKIDHRQLPSAPLTPAPDAIYGRYVAYACVGCHGPGLSGGSIPGAPPDWPAAANLTPGAGGVLSRYGDAAHLAAMFRSGQRPDGSAVSTVMPFGSLREMSDLDVTALYAFLATVPAREFGQR